jgi:hypothetical protein
MKKILVLSILLMTGCIVKQKDIKFFNAEIDGFSKSAESEAWCEASYCFNGGGFKGVLKLHIIILNSKSYKYIYNGVSHDCINSYQKIDKLNEDKIKGLEFLMKLERYGIFNMNTIDFEKFPTKEKAENPWEDDFYKIPLTDYMLFKYYVKIGNRTHEFEGSNIEIFKDERYKKVVELFNDFFKQKLGGLRFEEVSK